MRSKYTDLLRKYYKVWQKKESKSGMRRPGDEIEDCSFAMTYTIINDRGWSQKIRVDVAYFLGSCHSCQKASSSKQNIPYEGMQISGLIHNKSI